MPAFPVDRARVAIFVADHLEELRDYFLPGDTYRTSGEAFRDEAVRLIAHSSIVLSAEGRRVEVKESYRMTEAGWRALQVAQKKVRDAQRARDVLQQMDDQEYNARVWNGGWLPRPTKPGPTNLRQQHRLAWNAWHNRTRYAQMAHTATTHTEVLEASDPVDGHTVTFVASDLEPPLEDGTGNQLSATEEYFLRRHAQNPVSGAAYNRWTGHMKYRSLKDVHRFETRWTWQPNDPTADDACMAVAKPRAQLCLRAALTLPHRYHNRFVRWSTLDLLLDRLSPCFTPDYAAGLVNAVFQADPTYQARIDRLVAVKGCLGRRKVFPDTGIEPLAVRPPQPAASAVPSPDGHRTPRQGEVDIHRSVAYHDATAP